MTISDDPVVRAKALYAQEICARNFEEDLYLHLNTPGCIVFKDEESLALLRPVSCVCSYRQLVDPTYISAVPDAWWIYLLVGDFPRLLELLPNRFDLIGWERKNRPRFYELSKLRRWILRTSTQVSSALMAG